MKNTAFVLSLLTMLLFGAMDMTRGVAAPYMQTDWNLTYFQLGEAFASNAIGYLAGSFVSGFFADRFGVRTVSLVGGVATVVGLAAVIFMHSFLWLTIGFCTFGFGTGWLEIGVNAVVPAIARSEREQSGFFNTLHGLYGLGAFCFPVVAAWVIRHTGSWRAPYGIVAIGIVCVLIGMACNRTPLAASQAKAGEQADRSAGADGRARPGRSPLLYALLGAISAYAMAEIAVASWLPTYLVEVRGLSVAAGSFCLSGFYLTFTVGRLSAPLWVSRFGNYRSILSSAVFALLFLTVGLLSRHAVFAFIVAGLGFAVVFPTITSIASHTFAHSSGRALGFLFTASGIGGMLVNGLIGYLSTVFGLAAGFGTVLLFMAAVLLLTAVAKWQHRVQQTSAVTYSVDSHTTVNGR